MSAVIGTTEMHSCFCVEDLSTESPFHEQKRHNLKQSNKPPFSIVHIIKVTEKQVFIDSL
jgi:hypothetical protein